MAYGDYIPCCKCDVKLIYDGDRSQRQWWVERFGKEPEIECPNCKAENVSGNAASSGDLPETSLVYRLRKRAEIRRQISTRKSVQEGKPDRIADLLEEAADAFDSSKNRLIRIMGTFDLATGHADTMDQALDALESELRDVLGHLRARREWVGLTDEEIYDYADKFLYQHGSNYGIRSFGKAVEAKLKEKNT